MQTGRVDAETLRRLAEYESPEGPVLSFYLGLDPADFAIASARSTAIRSLVDDAHRRIRELEDLSHEARENGLESVGRVRDWFESPDFSAAGAHAVAVFCAASDGLFEAVKLPRPVESEVMIGRKPFVEPLVDMTRGGGWCVLLSSRESARIFRGSRDRLDEVAKVAETPARGQHRKQGLAHLRHQRSVSEDADAHFKRAAEVLYRRFKRAPFDGLVLGAASELAPPIEERLHPDLRARLVGRIEVDVDSSTVDHVLEAARPLMESEDRRAEEEAFERLEARLADGRAATGLDDVLECLTERRVEALLLDERFSATGTMCPRCGWLGPAAAETCPADATALERRDDIADLAIERALGQSAEVLVPQHLRDRLDRAGGIAAILRF